MTERSIHMDCFHHARRAEKVANQLDIWKPILRNVSNPGPDEWIDYIHRSVQYLRTIGDFIMFRNIGDIALQYLNIILLSHSSILSRILSYLKDPSPGMEEGWAEIMSYGAIDVHCQALIELHRCMTRFGTNSNCKTMTDITPVMKSGNPWNSAGYEDA